MIEQAGEAITESDTITKSIVLKHTQALSCKLYTIKTIQLDFLSTNDMKNSLLSGFCKIYSHLETFSAKIKNILKFNNGVYTLSITPYWSTHQSATTIHNNGITCCIITTAISLS